MVTRRQRAWILLLACALALGACYKKRQRQFGATCGASDECESGLCQEGYCTSACTGDDGCGGNVCLAGLCRSVDGDFDFDGLSNSVEKKLGLQASGADSDGDGVPDGTEVGDPSKPKDSNGDDVIDALQSNTKDKDGDCIVDAWDHKDGAADALPKADALCNLGICAVASDKVELVCDPTSARLGPSGCLGCVCSAPGLANWQKTESWCDSLDNDCDGLTDETAVLAGVPLGATCTDAYGACAAAGNVGKVECHDKAVLCSTGLGGSNAKSLPEVCNGVDDDCDGVTDNGFAWQGQAVGAACASCGGGPVLCSDGTPAKSAQVVCSPDGESAACSGTGFAKGFQKLGHDAPQPREVWSGLHVPAWHQLFVYGGAIPGANGAVLRDELWSLDTTALAKAQSAPSPWLRDNDFLSVGGDVARQGAALAWDEPNNRVVMLGGALVNGAAAIGVWAWGKDKQLQQPSSLPAKDPLYIAPLATSSPVQMGRRALASWMGTGNSRALVVVWPGSGSPLVWKPGATSWAAVAGGAGDKFGCLVPVNDSIVGLSVNGSVWQFGMTNGIAKATSVSASGSVPKAMQNAHCALLGNDLLVLGQADADESLVYVRGTMSGGVVQWKDIAASNPAFVEALRRSGGVLGVEGQSLVLAGGITAGQGHRHGLVDAVTWQPGDSQVTTVSLARPLARVGEAAGFTRGQDQFCIAGGLAFDLGDKVGNPARALPLQDAWCASVTTGQWQQLKATGLKPFAFGMAGVDRKTAPQGRLVMAGGLPLQPGVAVEQLPRLWQGQLLQPTGKIDPNWQPTSQVQTLDLATGQTALASSPGAPALAASSVAPDETRNRLLAFGGFDQTRETYAFWSLDLATLAWTNLDALLPKDAQGVSNHPNNRMGALMLYDPARDLLALTAGSLRFLGDNTLGQDAGQGEVGPCFAVNPPNAYNETASQVLWLASTLGKVAFTASSVPTFVNPQKGDGPLVRRFPGGPAFLPVLYDPMSARAWLAVQAHPSAGTLDAAGQPCAKVDFGWAKATVQVRFDVGQCSEGPVVASTAVLDKPPTALLLAASGFAAAKGYGVLWSGLDRDEALSGQLHRLDRSCVN